MKYAMQRRAISKLLGIIKNIEDILVRFKPLAPERRDRRKDDEEASYWDRWGIDGFEKLINNDFYYVDKTMFIADLLQN